MDIQPIEIVNGPEAEAPEAPEERPSLRDALEDSFEKHEAAQTSDEFGGRPRDEQGRFAKNQKTDSGEHGAPSGKVRAPAVEAAPSPAPTAAPVSQPPQEKAPQSWKPLAREYWGKLPPEVRQEVMRREGDIQRTLQETAEARKFQEEASKVIGPYEAMIRAEGSDPVRAVGALLATAAALRTAPPSHKANLVAQMVRHYGVDVQMLDQALAGVQFSAQSPQQSQFKDPRVDQILQRIESAEQARVQREYESAKEEIEDFGKGKDFFEDVRTTMADVLDIAERQGQTLTLDDAYQRAVAMHPDISKLVAQREAAARARTRSNGATARVVKSSSVSGAPTATPRGDGGKKSIRESLEDAWDQAMEG